MRRGGRGAAARHPPAAVARGRDRPRAGAPDPRRAHLGRRSARARRVLGAARRSVAQRGRDDLRLDPLHERGRRAATGSRSCMPAACSRPARRPRWSTPARRGDARGRLHRLSRGGGRGTAAADATVQAGADATALAGGGTRRRFSLRPPARLCDPRKPGALARSRPPGLRAARHRVPDAGVRLRHQHGCRPSGLRRARPRPHAGEPRLPREPIAGSIYFAERAPIAGEAARANAGSPAASSSSRVEIPPGFGRDLRRGRPDGGRRLDRRRHAVPGRDHPRLSSRARISASSPSSSAESGRAAAAAPATIETRFRYNQDFDSVNAMVPSTLAMLLALIPAILMALAVVREKELGSITNLYVTPVTPARVHPRQAAALHRPGHGQLRHPDR